MNFNTVGVIGAGVIGVDVAQQLAQTGHRVVLIDVTEEVLENARRQITNNLRFQTFFKKKEPPAGANTILDQIEFTTEYGHLREADFVIENVTENWEIKRSVYEKIDGICPPPCIFGANTSAITITRIASVTQRPAQVIGIHFMNPVPLKSTVELICGHHTSAETIEATRNLLAAMGKEGILVNDAPGFVSNRVLMLTINEAIFLLQEGVATAEDVDRIFKSCFGHKMGPLETADLIGLDTILYSIEGLHESFNDSKYRPCPLLRKMVDAGIRGRKSGEGFYRY